MNLYKELRKQNKLAAKRHPMFEKSRFAKIFTWAMALFWIAYLILIGVALGFGLGEGAYEAYDIMNRAMMVVLALDFLIRLPAQQLPTQEMKPYSLLPIKRQRLLDLLLLRAGMNSINLLWLALYIPFALVSVTKFWGFWGVFTYVLGMWMLVLANNYWFMITKTLIRERVWWTALPLAFYALLAVLEFVGSHHVSYFTMWLGGLFIESNPLAFVGVAAVIAALWMLNRMLLSKLVYNELSRVVDTKVKRVSEYKFLDRFGEVGEYMRLELKMLFRNKRTKASVNSIGGIIIFFSLMLAFSHVYDNGIMTTFIVVYNFSVFGMIILAQLMSHEGNYIDGLMARKESIMVILQAKYYLYSISLFIPFLFMLPPVFMGKVTILSLVSMFFLTMGVIYFLLFWVAPYNNKTMPLNESVTGRQSMGTGFQNLIVMALMFTPIILYSTLNALFGETVGQIIVMVIGIAFSLASPWWIKLTYKRFMARRYKNMEGFRDSR